MIISTTRTVDVELWARFIDKVIVQTDLGHLKWELHATAEHARYATCAMGNRTLRFLSTSKSIELVEPDDQLCWTIRVDEARRNRLIKAIGEQLTPAHMEAAQRFAREYCESPHQPWNPNPNLECECGGKLHRTPRPGGAVMICDRCGQ